MSSKFKARELLMHVHIVLFKDDVMDFTDSRCVFEYFLSVKVLGASALMVMCKIARKSLSLIWKAKVTTHTIKTHSYTLHDERHVL